MIPKEIWNFENFATKYYGGGCDGGYDGGCGDADGDSGGVGKCSYHHTKGLSDFVTFILWQNS